jgi:hypothetical protein
LIGHEISLTTPLFGSHSALTKQAFRSLRARHSQHFGDGLGK